MDLGSEVEEMWRVQPPGLLEGEFEHLFAVLLDSKHHMGVKTENVLKSSSSNNKIDSKFDIEKWLYDSSADHISVNPDTILDANDLSKEIISLCASSTSDDSLQMKLFDLIGATGFDFISSILEKSQNIKSITSFKLRSAEAEPLTKEQTNLHFSVMTESEKQRQSQSRKKEQKNAAKQSKKANFEDDEAAFNNDWLVAAGFDKAYLEQERYLGLQGGDVPFDNTNENSWMQDLHPNGHREYHEHIGLPAGTTRKTAPGVEEVFMPAPPKPPAVAPEDLVDISLLEPWVQSAFAGTKRLNRIQTAVFNTAFNSAENMLVCAPTGAGNDNFLTFFKGSFIFKRQNKYCNALLLAATQKLYSRFSCC
jgi:hypothetical protein